MTDKKNDRKVKEVLQDQELDKVIGGMVILVSYSFEHKLPPRGGFFLPKNYSLSGSYVLRKFTAGQLAGTIFLLPIKNHMVRRALKLQRTCRPLTINEPYRQACGMALEKYFQQKNCPRQSPLQRCRASRRFLFLSTHHKLSSPAAGAEGIHKWSVDVPREEKIFGRPFPRKRLSSKRSAFKPFSMMN